MTITDFLLARIAEDEWRAKEASGWQTGSRHEGQPMTWSIHMDRWSPTRVLVECEAKRQIVDDAANQHTSSADYTQAVRYLAAVYADHPDYDQSWRPA